MATKLKTRKESRAKKNQNLEELVHNWLLGRQNITLWADGSVQFRDKESLIDLMKEVISLYLRK